MQNEYKSPSAGTVSKLYVQEGSTVETASPMAYLKDRGQEERVDQMLSQPRKGADPGHVRPSRWLEALRCAFQARPGVDCVLEPVLEAVSRSGLHWANGFDDLVHGNC